MDWGRVVGVCLGFFIAIPVYIWLAFRVLIVGLRVFKVKKRNPPACLQDPEWGEHRYMKVNGVKIHYVEAGDVTKPLLVFVHGFPEFWFAWRHQLKYFKKDYRVVALDNRGYNDSEKPRGLENFHIKTLVDDIKLLVEGLGVKKFNLVGHDWGGAICWTFAALYPELLNNLVICNCPHVLSLREQRKQGWEQKLKSWYIVFFQCPVLPELLALAEDMNLLAGMLADSGLAEDSEEVEAYKYAFRDYKSWSSGMNYYRCAATRASMEFWQDEAVKQKIKSIKVRTLEIFGTGDKYLAVSGAQGSSKFVADHQLQLLDGVSHWVQQEAPTLVNSTIEKFLKSPVHAN